MDATSQTIIDHYGSKFNQLNLDEGLLASSYLNNFIIFSQKLESKSKEVTTKTNPSALLDNILDDNYDAIKQQ